MVEYSCNPWVKINPIELLPRVASSYADQSKFTSNTGSMNLRNLHNENYIAVYERGDVNAHGIDGSANIFVKKVRSAPQKL